jgi:protein-L-isoaspartate(D-aspartate) O-methyltransferase
MDDVRARERMVDEQIVARGVHDERVLDVLRSVPRHAFVPEHLRDEACGSTAADWRRADHFPALHRRGDDGKPGAAAGRSRARSGTGSGYQTAILARLASHVMSIERRASLAARAATILDSLGSSTCT